ncbi:MAG TPA: GNAT family N-acetyltransferase, partial [Thermomicrobiaceae bacterium]|nr:GNAT family N-acetyltransferase [Thermomicrobiaceae bacterium]
MLRSSRLRLRRILPSDQPHWERWLADPAVNRVLSSGSSMPRSPITLPEALAYWSADATDHVGFTMLTPDDEPIGAVQLADIEPWARHAELGIFIGEPANRSKGLGTEAMRLLLDFAFRQLN